MAIRYGPVAQLGAYHIRIVGVGSSNLLRSTNKKGTFVYQKFLFCLSKPRTATVAVRFLSNNKFCSAGASSRAAARSPLGSDDALCRHSLSIRALRLPSPTTYQKIASVSVVGSIQESTVRYCKFRKNTTATICIFVPESLPYGGRGDRETVDEGTLFHRLNGITSKLTVSKFDKNIRLP